MEKNGAWGEKRACSYLKWHGYSIIETNFRCRHGEIDIIAQKGGFLAFVEVKLRKNADFGEAKEFVHAAKQRRIIAAASIWLSYNETELQPRFDVIEVYTEGRTVINHLINAFEG